MDTGVRPEQSAHLPATEPPRPGHFYESPSAGDARDRDEAKQMEGLEEEIAMLRVRLKTALNEENTDFALVLHNTDLLVKAVLAQHRISPRSNKGLFARYASILIGFQDQIASRPEPGRPERND